VLRFFLPTQFLSNTLVSRIQQRNDFVRQGNDHQTKAFMRRKEKSNVGKVMEGESRSIPVVEEELKIGRQAVETGSVVLNKSVSEKNLLVESIVAHDRVTVERVQINREVRSAPPAVRYEGNKMIIPILKEEIVVQKKLILVEEYHITKDKVQEQIQEPVVLRKEGITIDQKKAHGAGPAGPESRRKRGN
jgi:uncharacterized protein (TIGR02271 family)